jgi:hypothetical protein
MKITVKIAGRAYEVEIGNLNTRPILATVDGQTFEVAVSEDQDYAAVPRPSRRATKNP